MAGGVGVPDAARPGAIRPGEERVTRPPAPPAKLFDVPPVAERPLAIDAGDMITVSAFELDGPVDRPEFDIAVAEVQALVDAKLAERPEGFTVGRLQEVADQVTNYYRERGLILAQAFVPQQTIEAGVVRIRVLEGTLGRVIAEGNKIYKEKILQAPFAGLIGEPVTKESMESALLALTDYPGVSLFGVFQPGQQVGTADMVVKVQEEKRFSATVRADNHGIRETGQNRYRLQGNVNNLTGAADRFTATAQATKVPANSFFWAAEYERPLFYPGSSFSVGFNRNQFDVGGAFRAQQIASDTRNLFLALSQSFIRSRQRNLLGRVELARKRASTKVRARPQSKDDLAVASLSFDYDSVDARFSGVNVANLSISHGFNDWLGAMGDLPGSVRPSRLGGNHKYAQGEFNKVLLTYTRSQSLIPLSDKLRHHALLLRGEVQWSSDLLVPLEQYSVGGPTNVRAYQPTEKLFDRAMFGSIEWIIDAPGIADQPAFGNRTWGEVVQLSFFFDIAFGKLNSALPSEKQSGNFKGVGFSLWAGNPNVFSWKLSVATPIGNPNPANMREPQYWMDLNLFF